MDSVSIQMDSDIRRNELLTVKEVATYLRVSRVTVWRWCQRGIVPASRVGRNWRIRRDDLLHMLNSPHQSPADNNTNNDPTLSESSSTKTHHAPDEISIVEDTEEKDDLVDDTNCDEA